MFIFILQSKVAILGKKNKNKENKMKIVVSSEYRVVRIIS